MPFYGIVAQGSPALANLIGEFISACFLGGEMGLEFFADLLDRPAESCKKFSFPEMLLHLFFHVIPVVLGNDPMNSLVPHDGKFPMVRGQINENAVAVLGPGHPQLVKNVLSFLENILPGVAGQVYPNLARSSFFSLADLLYDPILFFFRKKFFRMLFE